MSAYQPIHTQALGSQLIFPKRSGVRNQQSILVELESRKATLTADGSTYRFPLFRPLKDMVSIEIVGGAIPNRLYNIRKEFCSFILEEAAVQRIVMLPIGTYTPLTLSIALQSSIGSPYTVSFNATTGKLTFQNTTPAPFRILFGNQIDDTLARIVGFRGRDYNSINAIIEAPFACNPDLSSNRVYVFINNETSQNLGSIERHDARSQPHSILYMDEDDKKSYKFLNSETYQCIFYNTPAPLGRLATLEISLRDEEYRPLDLGGRDFSLLLEINCLE